MPTFAQLERKGKKLEPEEYIKALREYVEKGKEIPESAIRIMLKIRLTKEQRDKIIRLVKKAFKAQESKHSAKVSSYMAVLAALSSY